MARVKATESSRTQTCGGTIIENHWLLTSASCCEDVDSIQATFNDVHRSKNEAGEFTMNADHFEIHPSYGQGFDLCLVYFEENIIGNGQNSGAEVVCLSDTLPIHGSACWIAGWGRKDNGYFSWKLREATVNIFDRNYCKEFSNYNELYEDDICAGVPDRDGNGLIDGGVDACDGDSGGPLICDFDGRATLVGVISRGNGCALEGYPGIYSSIAHSYSWIQEIVGAEKIEDFEDEEPQSEFQSLSNIIVPNLQTCSHAENFPEERFFWTNRIVGGSLAEENQWPYIVRLDVRWGSWASYTCGGTVVDNHWVVSAAHCCVGMRTIYGTFSDLRTNRNEENEYTLEADHFLVQPKYGNGNNGYDICMIHFSEDIIATDPDQDVKMACINDALPAHGSSCWVAGWGTTQFYGQLSDKLLQAGVNIMDREYCIQNSHEMILFEDDICAGVPDRDLNGLIDGGIDACQGDSGGPLICAIDGKATLAGVVSRGYGCADEGYPGLYSSIAHSYDWIQELVRSGPPSSSAPSPPSTENNDGRSQSSGPVTECDSTTITISAHINDLYGNLPEDLWDEVRLIVGTCNGTQQHESGWIIETFELGTCGGEISQKADITFEWRVCGSRSLISRDGVYVASKLGFDAKCVYPSTTTVGTHVDVQQIKYCHDDLLIENDCVTPGNGSFSDLVQLDFYKDEAYQSEAVDLNIGEIIYGLISENKTSSFNFSYQITKCTTYQNSNKTGASYDLISSPCQETDSSHFLELDITDLTGKNSDSEDNASFHFNTFTFNENDDELHFECELKVCIEDFETGDLIDQNCIETCS
ncbi:Oidioi.mRNA.OKI2018_I69.chr2.g7642.t1.cds [Oikopleura dioica]|uniref:Oidioi.mRNA.OKI2018_I69.chr2.g7642.t1.cds n=1 Tax=Oikopleura dioica TaxID=34765 RepID=A0ABN7TFM7_OIKDI|nr:Oidioi.mRNA.OKI2018_I69.chr2.g7642.t1.cds [Oikopleura dioica]